tara:strand:+ start:556 stop:999 length:444 start_codon:yes stop_codon:yes gene_type:complete
MKRKSKYDSKHQGYTILNWIKYGIKSEDYKKLYNHHININNCQLCEVLFDNTYKNQRCLDHDHDTGLYRKTLCRSCNASYKKAPQKLKITNKSGHMWITNHRTKNIKYSFTWKYSRMINNSQIRVYNKSKIHCIALSFIYILKYPLI